MKNIFTLILIATLISMGLFGCLKKEQENKKENKILLGMVLLHEPGDLSMQDVVHELRTKWNLRVVDNNSGDSTSVLTVDGYTIGIGVIPLPIPNDEIKSCADFNYLWPKGAQEASEHKSHIILTIANAGKNHVKENLLYSKIASSILNNSNSIGIYIGGRSLLLKKDFYLENVEMMSEEYFPLYNWIYFGLKQEEDKRSIYTYGLSDFNKKEMEIINSNHSFEELNGMIYNLVHYVIENDVDLKHGETIGLSADQKLKITESEGNYTQGTTLKIEY